MKKHIFILCVVFIFGEGCSSNIMTKKKTEMNIYLLTSNKNENRLIEDIKLWNNDTELKDYKDIFILADKPLYPEWEIDKQQVKDYDSGKIEGWAPAAMEAKTFNRKTKAVLVFNKYFETNNWDIRKIMLLHEIMHFEVKDKGVLREYLLELEPFTSAGLALIHPHPTTLTPPQIESLNKLIRSMHGITSLPDEYLAEKEFFVKFPSLFIERFNYKYDDAKNRLENSKTQKISNTGLQIVINQVLWLKTIGSVCNSKECIKLKKLATEYYGLIENTSWLSPENLQFINDSIQEIVEEATNTKDNYSTLIKLYRKYRINYLKDILQIITED